METFKITMLLEPTLEKPKTKEEAKEWGKELGKADQFDLTLEEIGGLTTQEKLSWCHAVFDPQWIHQNNFKQTQLAVLDIDRGLSPESLIDRCREHDLPVPNIICRTSSDPTDDNLPQDQKLKVCKKYRAIWALDQPVYNLEEYTKLLKQYLYIIFPEVDTVGATQKWLPGKEVIWFDESPRLNAVNLICIADIWSARNIGKKAKDGGRRGRAKRFLKTEMPGIFQHAVPKTDTCLNIFKEGDKSGTRIRGFDWAQAAEECDLFRDFYYKTRKITNPELFGLFLAMDRIKSGSILWHKLVRENNLIDNRHLQIAEWVNIVLGKGDNPWEQKLSYYAPNDKATQHYERFTDIHFKKGLHALKLLSYAEYKLKGAELKLEKFMRDALSASGSGFWICKAATALGKTEAYVNSISPGCIVVVPNHQLKDEVEERLREMGKDFVVIPKEPELPEQAQTVLDRFRATGDYPAAARFLRRMGRELNLMEYGLTGKESFLCEKKINEYFDAIESCKGSDLPILTTHKMLIFQDFTNHHTVIIDEDIIPTIFEMGSFSSDALRRLVTAMSEGNPKDLAVLKSLFADIDSNGSMLRHVQTRSQGGHEIFENYEEVAKCIHKKYQKDDGQIIPFFLCDHYIVELKREDDPEGDKVVHYVRRHHLPEGKKYILLSASANEELCRSAFGDIEWCDISHVTHLGTRIQYSDRSFSRTSITNMIHSKLIRAINRKFAGLPFVTFKAFQGVFKMRNQAFDDIYFGNCSGYDKLKGMDIVVSGTPHIPTHVYRLMAAAIGIEFTTVDFQLTPQIIQHNGYKFRINTYEHTELRNIQFYFIESELIQATGRNRTLRTDAKCYLFSNYPLPGFEQRSTGELIGESNVPVIQFEPQSNLDTLSPAGSIDFQCH